ncbi:MAG: hypothetical protein M1815_002976 [Lichina confinis]|nr:MAG: hypothetical protein M1815_002976 [Lichina confinis]
MAESSRNKKAKAKQDLRDRKNIISLIQEHVGLEEDLVEAADVGARLQLEKDNVMVIVPKARQAEIVDTRNSQHENDPEAVKSNTVHEDMVELLREIGMQQRVVIHVLCKTPYNRPLPRQLSMLVTSRDDHAGRAVPAMADGSPDRHVRANHPGVMESRRDADCS